MALCMITRRRPPKRAPIMVDVILTIEAKATFIRERVKAEVGRMGWKLMGEADGPTLRLTYKVPIPEE